MLDALDQQKRFYPSRSFLSLDGDEGLSLLFSDLESVASEDEYNLTLTTYLLNILKTIGVNARVPVQDIYPYQSIARPNQVG